MYLGEFLYPFIALPYRVMTTTRYLANPFDHIYKDETQLSDRPEIQELKQYAVDLEDKIEGDFDPEYIEFEFNYNRLAYVRNGLLLAKLKFLRIYKSVGDGTFASFCRERLRITRWQINDNIKAARVAMELLYAKFEVLPANISQAMALASLTGEELIHAWRSVVESIAPDEITHKSIRAHLFPPTEKDLPAATLKLPHVLHESIHKEAAEQGLSIPQFLWAMLEFFISGGNEAKSYNSHPLSSSDYTKDYRQKEEIWREDLKLLAMENKQNE